MVAEIIGIDQFGSLVFLSVCLLSVANYMEMLCGLEPSKVNVECDGLRLFWETDPLEINVR